MEFLHPSPKKNQAEVVSEPLKAIKQMASHWSWCSWSTGFIDFVSQKKYRFTNHNGNRIGNDRGIIIMNSGDRIG